MGGRSSFCFCDWWGAGGERKGWKTLWTKLLMVGDVMIVGVLREVGFGCEVESLKGKKKKKKIAGGTYLYLDGIVYTNINF